MTDAEKTLRFSIKDGLAKNAHLTGVDPAKAELLVGDLTDSIFHSSTLWAAKDYITEIEKRDGEKTTKLSLEIIESYGFESRTERPDWDDVQEVYTLPNGIELTASTVMGNFPQDVDSLSGLDDWIEITTKEELDDLLSKTDEEVIKELAKNNPEFDISDYW